MALKLKIKKTLLKRKVDGVTKEGYYGRVITNGTKTFEDILKASTHGSTLDYREAELACKMMIDGIVDSIKQGYIVDLGVLGKLYPAVNGKWETDPDDLQLSDMKTKVNYKAGDDIAAAIKGAQLQWTTEAETDQNTVTNPDDQPTGEGGSGSQSSSGGSGSGEETLAAPVISGNTTFTDSSEVSIAAEGGAEIRYTTDGSTPTAESTLYSAAFTVTETTSVKAIAIKGTLVSEVASKTFVKSSGEGGMDQN